MNLENFPTSQSAIRMLSTITDGFYERSYVGKWIYQVMGMEMDDAIVKYDELQLQIFPENATWGIIYHEQKYGIPINPALSVEERRAEIIRRRDIHSPMNPARIEDIVKGLTNAKAEVTENVAPYTFAIDISTDGNAGQLNYSDIVRTVRKVKPSHLSFYAFFSASTTVNMVIETSAIEKWPLLAGEEFCGMRPVPAIIGKAFDSGIEVNMTGNIYRQSSEFAGTKPDINMSTGIQHPIVVSDIASFSVNKTAIMPGEHKTGSEPDVNIKHEKTVFEISQFTEGDKTSFASLLSGQEATGMIPGNETALKVENGVVLGQAIGHGVSIRYEITGEDMRTASIKENGVGTEVTGEGIQIIYTMCGEDS